ncbi:hypothetical protein CPB83DRAFT_858423 [Crepidotus variabilis]|uniref:Uncharacterized protein n=1 Tax=Crepidotus variabilis TaxID=179855 RepID=A0A9P6JN00_9AGAR|nr:hypothetical protein CPB83DRAFT_858423 [Crepidotus variabilis]
MLQEHHEIREPRLPTELEREIFELASRDEPSTRYSLIQVAKRVHKWVEPSLYCIFIICEGTDVIPSSLFLSSFKERLAVGGSTAIARQAKFVRHLMYTGQDMSSVVDLIILCTNIIDLAVWTFPGVPNTSLTTLTTFFDALHLKRLSVSAELIQLYPHCLSSLALSLTHLDCFGMHSPFWDDGWKILNVSHLTHLVVAGSNIRPIITAILKESKTIRLVINAQDNIPSPDALEGPWYTKDPRYVFCKYPNPPTACWFKGTNGGDDIWVLGEEAQRRKIQRLSTS